MPGNRTTTTTSPSHSTDTDSVTSEGNTSWMSEGPVSEEGVIHSDSYPRRSVKAKPTTPQHGESAPSLHAAAGGGHKHSHRHPLDNKDERDRERRASKSSASDAKKEKRKSKGRIGKKPRRANLTQVD